MTDLTPVRELRSGLVPKKLSLPKSEGPKTVFKSPLETLFNITKKKFKHQASQTDPVEIDSDTDSSIASETDSIKNLTMGMTLEMVPVFDGIHSKLNTFIDLVDAIHIIEDGKANEKLFATMIYHLKLSELVKIKLKNIKPESWAILKVNLQATFIQDPLDQVKALNELKEMVIQDNETLSTFVDRLIEKFTEFAKLTPSEETIRYQEKRTIEQISYYLSRDHRIIFGYPATLLEAKHILNNKKMGNTKLPKDFKPLEESGQPTKQNNDFQRYKYKNNFQQNFHSGNQVPQNFNPRYKGKNFNPFYNGNKPNFNQNNNNQNNGNQNNYRSNDRQNWSQNKNFAIEAKQNAILPPESQNGHPSRFISDEEYAAFLKFKSQKNE